MFTSTIRPIAVAALVAGLLSFGPGIAAAEDADEREVQRYVLTSAGLAKYSQATKKLAGLPAGKARSCNDDDGGDADAQSIGDMVAILDSVPGARAAVQGAGLTTREYVVFTLSLLQNGMAAWAVSQPGGKLPAGVSKANVDFVQAHDADLKQLEQYAGKNECADGDEGADSRDDAAEA